MQSRAGNADRFERAIVNENALPIRAQEILPEEAERIRKEFIIKEDGQIAKKDSSALEREIYLVPKTELIAPETLSQAVRIEATLPEIQKATGTSQSVSEEGGVDAAHQEDTVSQQQQTASESRHETVIKEISELPGFPKAPDR
ncbi:MAG: hypothetical protein HC887_02725 [Desulfobacteraceae bacterium]|nr:hypothetical protein [Desulfobacteraceae bacterium]